MPREIEIRIGMTIQLGGLEDQAAAERLDKLGRWLAQNEAIIDATHLADLVDVLESLQAIVRRARAANKE